MMTALDELMARMRTENRAALIAYVPAGFPSKAGIRKIIDAFVAGGVDAIEIGFPYSDPVMDGPTIQAASVRALEQGTKTSDVISAAAYAASKVPTVVMSYWNPIERYGVEKFASELATVGASGVITPDLTIEESKKWQSALASHRLNSIYVVAPSTTDKRLSLVADHCSGFIYAASLMGVTGARSDISLSASELVSRLRRITPKPIAVGLGVSTREHARDVGAFADGVIVGSAFVKQILEAEDEESAAQRVQALAEELAEGIREARRA